MINTIKTAKTVPVKAIPSSSPTTTPLAKALSRLTKREILTIAATRCKHGRSNLAHFACYQREHPGAIQPDPPERIGFLDIECSNLNADFGIILTWCIKDATTGEILEDALTAADVRAGREDKRIVASLIEAMKRFDLLVGFYSSKFDIPYIRARALILGVEFPAYGTIHHLDLYFNVRRNFKLSSRRLENCTRHLLGKTNKTRIDAKYWRNAARGDRASLKYILVHNQKDVLDTERLYKAVRKFQKTARTSI